MGFGLVGTVGQVGVRAGSVDELEGGSDAFGFESAADGVPSLLARVGSAERARSG